MNNPDDIRQRVSEYSWYHRLDLGNGIVTPGIFDLRPLLPHYGIPASLAGLSVLDVGPGHGFFAFEFEQRGAAKVVTAELPNWIDHDASPKMAQVARDVGERGDAYHRGALEFAIEARQSKVERRFCSVYDLTPERVGMFDLVFCASVLLHLTDPLRALFAIRRVCRDQAIICTAIDTTAHRTHEMFARFVGTPDGHAFWFPTMGCLRQMLTVAGFARVERFSTFQLQTIDKKWDIPHGTFRAFVQ
jgi:tRNA (mo5U34)-methyltransferase